MYESLWPKGTKVVVCLTGDVDAPIDIAENQLNRIFEVLDDYKVKYTFPITAQVFLDNFDLIKPIIEHEDEIAGHGDIHSGFFGQEYEVQKKRMEDMINIIKNISGIKVKGFRAPKLSGDLVTTKAANDIGLTYDSTATTYETWIRFGGKLFKLKSGGIKKFLISRVISGKTKAWLKKLQRLQPRLEALHTSSLSADAVQAKYFPFIPEIDGEKLDILVIPTSNVDDYSLIKVGPKLKNWRKVAKVWQKIFDDIYEANSLYVLLAHPRITGTKEFIGALRSLIEHAMNKGNVSFMTLSELTEWWKTSIVKTKRQ